MLPNRPEEVWHYIKELETRTVPVDNNPSSVEKNMRLTEEQRQVLIQMEKEQKAAEEAKKLEAQRKEQEATNAEKEAAISTVCASGVDLDADSISWMKREVSASYTVEASFVMAVVFFFIAALLNGVFEVHGRITGRFVLQEAMERCLYREEKTLRGDGMTVGEISSGAGQRLRGFFRCGDAVLTIREDGGDLDGRVKSSTETEISLRGQEPERAIRLLTVLENAE